MNSLGFGANSAGAGAGSSTPVKIVFVILALVALYYLYKFLYSTSGLEGKTVLTDITPANPTAPIDVPKSEFPVMLEGGEYSINMWLYISDWTVNNGKRKHVLTIGGPAFKTLAVYFGAYKNTLAVRVHNKAGACGSVETDTTGMTENLCNAVYNTLFDAAGMTIDETIGTRPCDINDFPLQKWVQVSIVLNNTTCDVYIDGKLARSCILKTFFKVDSSAAFKAMFVDRGGFGGLISNTSFYNYALNPEQVWKLYMSGPTPEYGLWDYIRSLFDPKAVDNFNYPKMNNV
jgi:hypothetical protein